MPNSILSRLQSDNPHLVGVTTDSKSSAAKTITNGDKKDSFIRLFSSDNQTIYLPGLGKYRVILDKPETSVKVQGLFFAADHGVGQVDLEIIHTAPRTHAQVELRGVATDQAALTLNAKIFIGEKCIQSTSFLTERVLLLSDQAQAVAKPELEILCNDVKCSHAASVSRIPQEQLFYLASRGIDRETAEYLVVNGWLSGRTD